MDIVECAGVSMRPTSPCVRTLVTNADPATNDNPCQVIPLVSGNEPTCQFENDARWSSGYLEVRFHVRLVSGEGEGRSVLCRVSSGALEDLGGDPGAADPMDLFADNMDRVITAVNQKIASGEFEGDGSVLITSREFG